MESPPDESWCRLPREGCAEIVRKQNTQVLVAPSEHLDPTRGAIDARPSMEACPKMVMCPVFPEFKSRAALRVMQTLYCEGDFSRCARYTMVSSGTVPPKTLLPDGTTLPASSATKK